MSSFISTFKVFLKDKVLPHPLFPKFVLVAIFYYVMLPKAVSDLKAVTPSFRKKVYEDMLRMQESGKKFTRTGKPYVLGLVGLPQTGKSTVAEILMVETGLIPVNSNLIRNWLIDAKRDYANIDAIVLHCMMSLIKSGEIGVIMDSDCVSPVKRAFINALAWWTSSEVEYLGVTTAPDVWRMRIASPGHFIHRMYKDGVHFGNIATGNVHALVFPEHVRNCAVREWERQTPMHTKYLSSTPMIGNISNNTSTARLKEKVKTLAGSIVL
jgi:hypothetical protein